MAEPIMERPHERMSRAMCDTEATTITSSKSRDAATRGRARPQSPAPPPQAGPWPLTGLPRPGAGVCYSGESIVTI